MHVRAFYTGGLVAALSLASPTALGQSQTLQNRAVAEQLFKDGNAAMAAHDYATACPKLEEVTRLVPGGINAKYRLASCYEGWGKVTSAWAAYRIVATTAPATDTLKSAAADRVAALEPKLPRLTVRVSAAARALAGLEVRRDGLVIGVAQWGEALPVDPGPHVVTAKAAQKKAWSVTLEAVTATPETIEVPALGDDPPAPTIAPLAPPPPAEPGPATQETTFGSPAWAWVVGGLGLATGVAGIVFLGTSIAGQSYIDTNCGLGKPDTPITCNTLRLENNVRQELAWALGGSGALALGVGIVGIATAHPGKQAPAIYVTPRLAVRGAGASLGGSF
jgi:hypothetical protein